MNHPNTSLPEMEPMRKRTLVIGLGALGLCLLGAFFNRQQFFLSYLTAYLFWLGIPLGALGIVMIHHLVGGTWGFIIQRPLEAAIRTFPVMALLFLPLFFGLSDLYVWARPEALAQDKLLQEKSLYLNVPFFVLRALLYFAIWIVVGYFLTRWSREQDRAADGLVERLQTLSGPGLILYGLTVTFSAIDWLMSLEPQWYSTIYGMIFMVSHGLVALAFVTAIVYFLSRREPLSEVISPFVFQDLGNLLLAFVMLWAYLSFSQFLLIWVENLTKEIPWYFHRTAAGWGGIAISLIVLQFALPFLLLLSRTVKRKAATLCAVAVLIMVMHLIELFWFVAPTFYPAGLNLHWTLVLAPIGIGGVWFSAFVWQLKEQSLLPLHDPRFVAILEEQGLLKNG
jgi:hypothetical protein